MNSLQKAIELARVWHKGQKDKAGVDYFKHPEKVASFLKTEKEKIVAYLHDILEDTKIPIDELKKYFSDDIIEAILLVTKKQNQNYETYLSNIKKSKLATAVKLADLKHNSDLSRIKQPKFSDHIRADKYKKAIDFLSN
jgi:(p)ppGpp synthase/HD superfamily hydrolase